PAEVEGAQLRGLQGGGAAAGEQIALPGGSCVADDGTPHGDSFDRRSARAAARRARSLPYPRTAPTRPGPTSRSSRAGPDAPSRPLRRCPRGTALETSQSGAMGASPSTTFVTFGVGGDAIGGRCAAELTAPPGSQSAPSRVTRPAQIPVIFRCTPSISSTSPTCWAMNTRSLPGRSLGGELCQAMLATGGVAVWSTTFAVSE